MAVRLFKGEDGLQYYTDEYGRTTRISRLFPDASGMVGLDMNGNMIKIRPDAAAEYQASTGQTDPYGASTHGLPASQTSVTPGSSLAAALSGGPVGGSGLASIAGPTVAQPTITRSDAGSQLGRDLSGTAKAGFANPQTTIADIATYDDDNSAGGGGGRGSAPAYTPPVVAPPRDVDENGNDIPGGWRLRMKAPDGQWHFTKDIKEIGQLIERGWQPWNDGTPENPGGTPIKVEEFQGGLLLDGLPLNTVFTGFLLPEQKAALEKAGRTIPSGVNVYEPQTANSGNAGGPPTHLADTGWLGNQGATGQQLTKDFTDMLKGLMQQSLDQGAKAQQSYAGILSDLKDNLGFLRASGEQDRSTRDSLVQGLIGDVRPSIQNALAGMNEGQGLSPQAMQALRLNAIEAPQYAYQGQVQQLKENLGARGAYGGETPGSTGDIIRGYAPLLTARDSSRSNMLANTILADEQRKFESLGLNRQTGLQAMGTAAGLTGTLGNIYNPANTYGAMGNTLGDLLTGMNAYNASGFQGISTAGNIAGVYGQHQPSSVTNTLLAALASIPQALSRTATATPPYTPRPAVNFDIGIDMGRG